MAVRSVVTLASVATAALARESVENAVNPIRRVVTMLQMMQKKITAEGEKEKKLFDKFMCYCQTGAGELQNSIDAADTKIPQVESALKESAAMKTQLEADVKQAQSDRAEAKAAIAKATSLREKEAATFAKDSSDMKTNLAAMAKAIAAIEGGMSGSAFLQTSGASTVRKLAVDMDISAADRDQLMSFLSESADYAPQSGSITGILKQMKDTMTDDLARATEAEKKAVADFDSLISSKEKEINACQRAIESKVERIGNLGVEIETMKADLTDTEQDMLEDKKFLEDMDEQCATKKQEWEERCKTRTEELLALADTIKILNDDDALELFKKTLPAPALLQVKVSDSQVRKQAIAALGSQHSYHVDLISLALRGKKISFDKVIGMIDDMVTLLGKEQVDDENKKEVCEMQIDKAEDDIKVLETTMSDLEKSISEGKDNIATLTDEIADLTKGLKQLDKDVEEQMDIRKEEHEDYVNTMAANTAARDLILFAKNRMQKFYNPKMYKAPPKRELSEEERITLNMGGTLAPTEAPGGIAGTGIGFMQVSLHKQADTGAPPPPPETFGAYSKKSGESNGVMTMMDMLVADLDKEMQEMEVEEKNDQAAYEKFTKEAAEKRVTDSKSVTDKEGAKADAEATVEKETGEKQNTMKETFATVEFLKSLHGDCDWLLQNFDVRKEARAGEVDALKKAKAVLSGADFSLVQTKRYLRRA
jgi:peptidoglycan hydrolase CwlO-like protein